MNSDKQNKIDFLSGINILEQLQQGKLTSDSISEPMPEHGIIWDCDVIDLDGEMIKQFAKAISLYDGLLIVGSPNGVKVVCTKENVNNKIG